MDELMKIGEVSKLCDIPIKTLRFYEEEGLITPTKVDRFTGYRFYNDEAIIQIYRVKFLRELGFSIKEVREFNESSINEKLSEIEKQIERLKSNRQMLSFLKKQKGDLIMKNFVNDVEAIGKWEFEGSALSKADYLAGKTSNQVNPLMTSLYFLPNGEGYWVFERWTKGMLLHFSGEVYTYEIEGDKLYLTTRFEGKVREVKVFKQVDAKEYNLREICIKDDINLPFVEDKKALGAWEAIDYIDYAEKKKYVPKASKENLFLKAMTFNPNGEVVVENSEHIFKKLWTKGKVINQYSHTVSDYTLKNIDGESYLIMDWKSGDYSYQGQIYGCYVLKKI